LPNTSHWVGKTLKNLQETIPKEWIWIVEEVRQLLDVLHPEGHQRLQALWKQLPGRSSRPNQAHSAVEQLRDLLLRLSRDWHSYCTFQSEPEVPWTNNSTERAINACWNRTWLQILARHGIRSDVSWNRFSLISTFAGLAFVFSFSPFRPPPL
jgi:hypothetical protein